MPKTELHDIFELGVRSNASDWHFREGTPVTLRIDSELVDTDYVAKREALVNYIDEITNEAMKEKLRETGDLDLSFVEEGVGRFRVNIHKQRGMIAISMRHVKSDIFTLDQLGMPPGVKKVAEIERGIVIVSGTTGSGKSTTLASLLNYINKNYRRHIITIEDPIEYEFKDEKSVVEQREVGLDTKTFNSALEHILRQDPDIIMIGEMRNSDSFDAALQAADTGHLVMTTLHATNAPQAVTRILDFYDSSEHKAILSALSVNLRAVLCQRLLPRAFGGGVVPGAEIMLRTPLVSKLIEERKLDKLTAAVENSQDEGMISFNQSLLQLVNDGAITEEDALRSASNPDALKMNLKGIFLDSGSQIVGN